MKREDVVAGGEYATDLGEHVQIAGEEPGEDGAVPMPSAGWAVIDGEWVRHEEYGQRKVRGGEYKRYQTNVALRAINMVTGERVAVEPRRLTMPWSEHVEALREAQEAREAAEANAAALEARAEKVKGVWAHADPKKQEVRLSFESMDTLLRKAKV